MIGMSIITKEGILLFSHFFEKTSSLKNNVDEDLRAGLMTAIINAFEVDNAHESKVKTINQGSYHAIMVEGEKIYGLFFTYEDNMKDRNFAISVVNEFERRYRDIIEDISLDGNRFDDFENFIVKEFSSYIKIDVDRLPKVLEIMSNSVFTDYVILERPYLHQVFTSVSIPEIKADIPLIVQNLKYIIDVGNLIQLTVEQLRINFANKYSLILFTYKKYIIILFLNPREEEKALKELYKLKSKIDSV